MYEVRTYVDPVYGKIRCIIIDGKMYVVDKETAMLRVHSYLAVNRLEPTMPDPIKAMSIATQSVKGQLPCELGIQEHGGISARSVKPKEVTAHILRNLINHLKNEYNITIQEMAKHTGCSRGAFSNYRNSKDIPGYARSIIIIEKLTDMLVKLDRTRTKGKQTRKSCQNPPESMPVLW